MKRCRADKLLEQVGLAESRTQAQRIIMAGEAWLGDQRIDKASFQIKLEDAERLEVRSQKSQPVGRGGSKLEPVLNQVQWDVTKATCIDVGASTGGFTEVLLTHGAKCVWAVDVGYGQLHERLRNDDRVVVRERVNFRHWDADDEPMRFDYAVMDVSFISTRKLLVPLHSCLKSAGRALILVKPQFELEPRFVEKGGIVRDPAHIETAIQQVADFAIAHGYKVMSRHQAGITGKKGNQESFLELVRQQHAST